MTLDGNESDESTLRSVLTGELSGAIRDVRLCHEGLNRTYVVETERDETPYVCRIPGERRELPWCVDLQTEFAVLDSLRETPVPAPEPVTIVQEHTALDSPVAITTYCPGVSIPLGERLPTCFRSPAGRHAVATGLIDQLAALHTVDTTSFEAHCADRSIADQVRMLIEQFERVTADTALDVPSLRRVAAWLDAARPEATGVGLNHGDFRPGNVLFEGEEAPTLTGVLDWETPFLGDPRLDLGYFFVRWDDPAVRAVDVEEIETANDTVAADLQRMASQGLAPFTSEPGCPSREKLIDRYERQTGTTIEHERFFRVLGGFALATVWATLHRTARRTDTDSDSDWPPYIVWLGRYCEHLCADRS